MRVLIKSLNDFKNDREDSYLSVVADISSLTQGDHTHLRALCVALKFKYYFHYIKCLILKKLTTKQNVFYVYTIKIRSFSIMNKLHAKIVSSVVTRFGSLRFKSDTIDYSSIFTSML